MERARYNWRGRAHGEGKHSDYRSCILTRSRVGYGGKSDSFVRRRDARKKKKEAILTCQTINERRRIVGLYPRNVMR